jgi:isochorismate synthase
LTDLLQHIAHINRLIDPITSFALYRLPGEQEPVLILQHTGMPQLLNDYTDLNGCEGFVLAPFHITSAHPLLLIRPDRICNGRMEIITFLQSLEEQIVEHKAIVPEKISSAHDKNNYQTAFARFIEALHDNRFDKLVLSRRHIEARTPDFSPATAFLKACDRYPNAFTYLCHTPLSGTWMGSTPEMILKGKSPHYQTVALAGTRKAKTDGITATRWDSKNRNEQQLVADYLRKVLSNCADEWTDERTETLTAGNVVHLKTGFRFDYSTQEKLGNLLQQLHPTPAVCGLPKTEAYRFIVDNEGYDREYYAGFTGFISPDKQTDLYVNLRCMKIEDERLNLYAGGGLLSSSNRETEWKETEEKLKTMRGIL